MNATNKRPETAAPQSLTRPASGTPRRRSRGAAAAPRARASFLAWRVGCSPAPSRLISPAVLGLWPNPLHSRVVKRLLAPGIFAAPAALAGEPTTSRGHQRATYADPGARSRQQSTQ